MAGVFHRGERGVQIRAEAVILLWCWCRPQRAIAAGLRCYVAIYADWSMRAMFCITERICRSQGTYPI
jgi:hypothetical protein